MITPQEIAGKALRRYSDYQRSIIQDISFFPLHIPADKKASTDFSARHKQLEALIGQSKERTGYGYSLQYRKVFTRKHGEQDEVDAILFEREADYLRFLDKEEQSASFKWILEELKSWRAGIKDWLLTQPPDILHQYADAWKGICGVVDYLLQHKVEGYYLRTLPVPVHTKFIQRYQSVIFSLLKYLQPERFCMESASLEEALGLLKKPHLFTLRWLDQSSAVQYSSGMEVFGISVEYLKQVNWSVKRVILVENETNLFLLPSLPDTVALISGGGALHLLKEVPLFQNTQLYYWGDLDEKGFVLLHDIRLYYPRVSSLMMDEAVVAHHQHEIDKQPRPYREKDLPALSPTEKRAFLFLAANSGRIEQEKLDQSYMQACLSSLLNPGQEPT